MLDAIGYWMPSDVGCRVILVVIRCVMSLVMVCHWRRRGEGGGEERRDAKREPTIRVVGNENSEIDKSFLRLGPSAYFGGLVGITLQ